jgi:hypothetical protein
MIRQAAFPGTALLDHPDTPAVIIAGIDDPVGKRRIKKKGLLSECCMKSCLIPGKTCNRSPFYGMRCFSRTGLVADAGHGSTLTLT